MSVCRACEGAGLIAFLPHDNPKSESDAGTNDLSFAVCLCPIGQTFRVDTNNGHKVAPQYVLWAARNRVDVSRMALVENVYSADELAAVGLQKAPVSIADRTASMLAAGKKTKR